MTELLLIRHGETRWNTETRFQGQADSDLTTSGVHQARLLARRLADIAPAAVYTSDLGRAASTAEIIASACKLEALPEHRLRERNVGLLTGLTFDQIKNEHALIWERYFHIDYRIPGGGESLRQVLERAHQFLAEIVTRHKGERIVAVSHGALISALLRDILHIPPDAPRSFSLLNCAVNRLEYLHDSWRLRVLGDTAHLEADTLVLDEVQ